MPAIERDWYPAREVLRLGQIEKVVDGARQLLSAHGIAIPADADTRPALRTAIVEAWEAGLRDDVHRQLYPTANAADPLSSTESAEGEYD